MRGLPRDAIPAIDRPTFVTAADARFMQPREYVIGITDGSVAKAYSTWQLNAHEIVNDTLNGRPIAVTWCPLCYTGVVYRRQVGDRTLSFGVGGMLWRENLVMYDRETDSWWAQATGRGIRGSFAGATLAQLPATLVTWQEWRARYPGTLVLSKRPLPGSPGQTEVYLDYHRSGDLGVTGRLRGGGRPDPKTKILGIRLGAGAMAVTLEGLERTPLLIVTSPEGGIVVAASGDRSGARVFRTGAHAMTVSGGRLLEDATNSTWDGCTGTAVNGRLKGTQLDEVPATLAYWFAWRAFYPDSVWMVPPR
jgi:hypothetical protein